METINGILYISDSELIKSESNPMGVMSLSTYKKNYSTFRKGDRGSNGRRALIEYNSLPLKYRQAWEELHGMPQEDGILAPMAERLRPDWAARDFYEKHRYGAGKQLKPETQLSYSQTAVSSM